MQPALETDMTTAAPITPPCQLPSTLAAYAALLEHAGILADQSPVATRTGRNPDLMITHVSCDSRDVQPGTLFICKGAAFDVRYLEDACAAGAVAYVAEHPFPGIDAPCLAVTNIRDALGLLADRAWGHPSSRIGICAITGTKGKTTTAFCLRAILDARAARLGLPRCPIFSTIVLDDGLSAAPATLTTPEPLDLQRHLANAVASGADALVMEASSQALKYGRMAGVELAVAAFTNISEDHISPIEHPTFEDYLASKLRIFEQCRTAVVNLDLDSAQLPRVLEAAATCERLITFSTACAAADVRVRDVRHDAGGLCFDLVLSGAAAACIQHEDGVGNDGAELVDGSALVIPLRLSMLGTYNVENALAAIACALTLGATLGDVRTGLAAVRVPGRMELAYQDESLAVIVDYAHNGSSLESLLTDVHAAYPGRAVTCVFGATGTKGVERRFGMGEAAGKLADRIVITEDDPGLEDPADIAVQIERAAREAGGTRIETVLDRREAIRRAIAQAQRPAVVVLAGKGHEEFMIRGRAHEPYAGDAATVREVLGDA